MKSDTPSTQHSTDIDRTVVESMEALGSRQRLEILVTLADRKYDLETDGETMTFTELYEAIDCPSSSQFSYHLNQLVDTFIIQTSDGYRLTYAGDKVQRAIFSGLYQSPKPIEPFEIDGFCPSCESHSLVACSRNDQFAVRCQSCDCTLLRDLFPRSIATNRSTQEIVDSFGHSIWAKFVFIRGGVCPECYGTVDTEIEQTDHGNTSFTIAINRCSDCRFTVTLPVDVIVAFHPAVTAAFWHHGLSLLDTPLWELFEYFAMDCWEFTVRSETPFVAQITITLDDIRLQLSVDDTLSPRLIARSELNEEAA